MTRTIEELTIPKSEGRVFEVKKGEVLRIIEIEGPQAADLMIFNLNDYRESFSAWLTRVHNRSFTKAKKIYSKFPADSIMFTVLGNNSDVFWLNAGRCNSVLYREQYRKRRYHKNCHDILKESLEPYGISEWDLPDVLNIFMKPIFGRDGSLSFVESPIRKGDFVELRAEMNCLVAASACPDDIGAYNGKRPKPLGIQIIEQSRNYVRTRHRF